MDKSGNRTWHRRHILGGGLGAGLILQSFPRLAQAAAVGTSTLVAEPFVIAETRQGRVRGGQCRGAVAFKGIPYAGPVTGANRFKAPSPPLAFNGIFDATHLGPPTLQKPNATYGEQEPPMSENGLVLNIWTTAVGDGGKRPVMLYIHGGGFLHGSGGSITQDGGRLAATQNVVVVTLNHRLGLFGHLYLGEIGGEAYATSGNQGIFDIIKALEWVRDNIEGFGGNAGNVTIMGESGGGGKVGTLLAMTVAKGLFHKASIESGAFMKRMPKANATETALRLLKALGIGRHELHKLNDVPTQLLLDIQLAGELKDQGPLMEGETPDRRQYYAGYESTLAGRFGPVVDGVYLPHQIDAPGGLDPAASIPLIVGCNKDEATLFNMGKPELFSMNNAALRARLTVDFGDKAAEILTTYRGLMPAATPSDIYTAIITARTFGNGTTMLAELKSKQPAPVYAYRYDYQSNRPIPGTTATLRAGHASDIGPMFYNYDQQGLHGDGPGLEATSRHMSTLWANFARTGSPTAPEVPEWPRYTASKRSTMLIDAQCRVVNDPDSAARKMWARLYGDG